MSNSNTAIFQLLLSTGAPRVYREPIPDNPVYPLVVYTHISDVPDYHYQGPGGLRIARFQVDCWASTSSGATELADLIELTLSGYKGEPDSIDVQFILLENAPEMYDDDAQLHRVLQEYKVMYRKVPILTTT